MNKELFEFMDIYNDKSLENGAWQQMLMDSVEVYNKVNDTTYDPYQSFMDYVMSDQEDTG